MFKKKIKLQEQRLFDYIFSQVLKWAWFVSGFSFSSKESSVGL